MSAFVKWYGPELLVILVLGFLAFCSSGCYLGGRKAEPMVCPPMADVCTPDPTPEGERPIVCFDVTDDGSRTCVYQTSAGCQMALRRPSCSVPWVYAGEDCSPASAQP